MALLISGLLFGLAPGQARSPSSGEQAGIRRSRRRSRPLALALALLAAASMWFYVQGVLVPYQLADALRYGRPRGNLSDLYPRWLGARELLLDGRDPYSQPITREIQLGYYGRPLDPSRPHDPKDQQGFAYPVYVAFLLAPTLHMDFSLVRVAFTWVLAALIVLTVVFWVKAMRWPVSRTGYAIFTLLVMGSFPAAQGIKLQQLTILVSAMIAAAAAALVAGWLWLAGLLLALSTIKPQLVVPLLIFLLIWVVGNWRKRWSLLASFTLCMVCLLAGAEWVLPGWIPKFLTALAAYRQYTGGVSILGTLLTPLAGAALTAGLLVLLALLSWKLRREPASSSAFTLLLSLVLAVTVVVIPTFAPYNQLFLLPALILLVQDWRRVARLGTLARLLYLVVALLVIWPWIATFYLSAASFFRPPAVVQQAWTLPLYTSVSIPFGIMALLAIYGARSRFRPGA